MAGKAVRPYPSYADLVPEVREARLANARDVLQVLDGGEVTLRFAVLDDALGKRWTYAR